MAEPYEEPYDDDQLRAAGDAYERQYTHDDTPTRGGPSCPHRYTRPLSPSLDECRDCGAILNAY